MRGREHSIVLPDATRTAQSSMHRGSRTRCIPLASVMGIEPIGRWVWRPDRQRKDHQWSFLGRSLRPVAAFSAACLSRTVAYRRSKTDFSAPLLAALS